MGHVSSALADELVLDATRFAPRSCASRFLCGRARHLRAHDAIAGEPEDAYHSAVALRIVPGGPKSEYGELAFRSGYVDPYASSSGMVAGRRSWRSISLMT